jgi:signal peptidase I
MENIPQEPFEEPDVELEPCIPEVRPIQWALVLRQFLGVIRELAETIIPAVVIAIFINLFLVQATQVLGQSMEPNLHTKQRVLVEKVSYRFLHAPKRGDIVVIDLDKENKADDMLIKRVIGLPGDTIEIRNGEVYIDGDRLDESWTINLGGGNYGPTTIPPLHVFVMGDNRGASNDSRSFGPVHVDNLVGHAWFSYWPPEDVGFIK